MTSLKPAPQTIYVHPPKTGGTFVQEVMKKQGLVDEQQHGNDFSGGHTVFFNVSFKDGIISNKTTPCMEFPFQDVYLINASLQSFPHRYPPELRDQPMRKWLKPISHTKSPVSYFRPLYTSYIQNKSGNVIFGTVRNPFSLLVSYYNDVSSGRGQGWEASVTQLGLKSFEEFVKAYCDLDFPWICKPQQYFYYFQFYYPCGNPLVHLVIRQEKLNKGLIEIGFDESIVNSHKHAMVTPNKTDYRRYYTTELVDFVKTKMWKELEIFGYNFHGPIDNKSVINMNWNFHNSNSIKDLVEKYKEEVIYDYEQ